MKRASPSKYKNLELSPAFEQDPNRPEHPITAEGIACHRALETGDDRGLEPNQLRMVEACRDLQAALIPEGAVVRHELRFENIVDGDPGIADLVALKGDRAWILDWKFAFNPQTPVPDNPAAQAYVLAVFTTFPYLRTVDVYYAYPRLDEVSHHQFRRSDCERIVARLRLIKERHNTATPETCTYHDSTCGYCKHLATCPTAARKLLPLATAYNETHDAVALPAIGDYGSVTDPQKMGRLYSLARVLEDAASSIRHHTLVMYRDQGIEIPGVAVRTRRGKISIDVPTMAWDIAQRHGITKDEFLSACSVNASTLAEHVYQKTEKGKAAAKQKFLDELLDSGAATRGEDTEYLAKASTPA